MSVGMLMLILALFALAGLGIAHKVADFKACRPSVVTVTLFFWASAILWSYTIFFKVPSGELFPPFTGRAVLVAAICGACAGFGILTFQIGVRYGPITTSWLVVNLSTLVPAILSLLVYREWRAEFKWQHPVAVLLVLTSVLLLWRDKVVLNRAGDGEPAGTAPEPDREPQVAAVVERLGETREVEAKG